MLHPRMTDAERQKLVGKQVVFTVTRDGIPVERGGEITRLTPTCIWIGAWCYHVSEPQRMREVAEVASC